MIFRHRNLLSIFQKDLSACIFPEKPGIHQITSMASDQMREGLYLRIPHSPVVVDHPLPRMDKDLPIHDFAVVNLTEGNSFAAACGSNAEIFLPAPTDPL